MTANPARPARYRPGKPIADSASESEPFASDSEAEEEAIAAAEAAAAAPKPIPTIRAKPLKTIDLEQRIASGKAAEAARLAAEHAQSDDEYTTDDNADGDKEDGSEEEEDSDDEDEGSDEDGDDYAEEEAPKKVFLRPTFVPRNKRAAGATEKASKEEEEARLKTEAATLLEQHLKCDAEAKAAGRKGWDDDENAEGGIDDTDGLDPVAERATWKLRELLRIKRERDQLEEIEKEREAIERRREMDPEVREREDIEYVRVQRKGMMESRGKMGFMQKFYHKGAFYQDNSEILKRNYATAAVQDTAKNRELLPKYMQVRGDEVGKRGRTKWTHLTAEDTSLQSGGSPWFEKKSTGRFPPPPGEVNDERFMPDRNRERDRDRDNRDKDGETMVRVKFSDGDKRPQDGPRTGKDREEGEASGDGRDRGNRRDRGDRGDWRDNWDRDRDDRRDRGGDGRDRRDRSRNRNRDRDRRSSSPSHHQKPNFRHRQRDTYIPASHRERKRPHSPSLKKPSNILPKEEEKEKRARYGSPVR
jgi:microfibrillar-associated protein 1